MKGEMKAARLHAVNQPLSIDRVPIPECGPGEVLVQVKACGICGSDLHMLDGTTKLGYYPMTLGHEFAGVIAEVGPEVEGWQSGDRVCVDFLVTCGQCLQCLTGRESICPNRKGLGLATDGGFAEFAKVPAKNLISLPENIPFEIGAIITDAVATPFHAITKRSNVKLGDTVVVFGAGGLGVHAIQLLRLCGTFIIAIDISDTILERAKTFGADVTINAQVTDPAAEVKKITSGMGADVAFEFIGLQETIYQTVNCLRPGGRAVIVGLGGEDIRLVNPGIYVRSEFEVVGSYAFERKEIEKLVSLVAQGKLDLSRSVTK
ncbi:MAG: alcohol dehydrogenase catalytic domain-containing protein, partial [Clostridia bacterium]|nr:alcohol dehydrogenase catalytic domain-containing protein [Clostridia bacterium]